MSLQNRFIFFALSSVLFPTPWIKPLVAQMIEVTWKSALDISAIHLHRFSVFVIVCQKWANPSLFLFFIFDLFSLQLKYKLKNRRCCTWGSNPGPHVGTCRRIHWAMTSHCYCFQMFSSLMNLEISISLLHFTSWPGLHHSFIILLSLFNLIFDWKFPLEEETWMLCNDYALSTFHLERTITIFSR